MRVWLTSDTHFGHENIIRYCGRPFRNAAGMNLEITRRWNETVEPDDLVYHLGDFAMGGGEHKLDVWREYCQALNGTKILVRGNHDRSADFMRDVGFDDVHDNLIAEVDGRRVWMNHYPPVPDIAGQPLHRPPAPGEYDIALCGHVHQQWRVRQNVVNVGVDVWDFRPIRLVDILRARALSDYASTSQQWGPPL